MKPNEDVYREALEAIAVNGRICYELGCFFNGPMYDDDKIILLYTDAERTKTTFSIKPGDDFRQAFDKVMAKFYKKAALVVIGQGTSTREIKR